MNNCPYCNNPYDPEKAVNMFSSKICEVCIGSPFMMIWRPNHDFPYPHYFKVIFYVSLEGMLYRIDYFPNEEISKISFGKRSSTPDPYSLKALCHVKTPNLHPDDLLTLLQRCANLKAFI